MSDRSLKGSHTLPPAADEVESSGPASGGGTIGANRRLLNRVFFILAAILAATLAYLKHGPQSASAAHPGVAAAPAAFDEFLVSELPGIRNVDHAMSNVDRVVDDFRFVPSKVQVPLTKLKVNPFRQPGTDVSPADALEDSAARQLREQERQSALQAVQSLRLQSIMGGGSVQRYCTINSVRYQEGQEAGGFLVEEIASNTVVVRKGAYRFELKPSM